MELINYTSWLTGYYVMNGTSSLLSKNVTYPKYTSSFTQTNKPDVKEYKQSDYEFAQFLKLSSKMPKLEKDVGGVSI